MFQDFINHIKSRKLAWAIIGALILFLMIYSWFFQKPIESTPSNAKQVPGASSGTTTISNPAATANGGASVPGAAPTQFEEGRHYKKLPQLITDHKIVKDHIAETPGKIQVIEFFNYGCFWCQQLHPLLNEWTKTKPISVVFYRYPVVFNKQWDALARTYLVVKKLEKTDALDMQFFSEIHQKRINLADEKLLREFLTKQNVAVDPFFELYNSFAINSEMAMANEISNAFQITLSPSVVINTPTGSYFATATMVGTEKNLIALIDFLIAREEKELNKDKDLNTVDVNLNNEAK